MIRRALLLATFASLAFNASASAWTTWIQVWPDPPTITYYVSTANVPKGVNLANVVTTVQFAASEWARTNPRVTFVYGGTTTRQPFTRLTTCTVVNGTVTQAGTYRWNGDGQTVIGFEDLFAATCRSDYLGLTGCYLEATGPECDVAIDSAKHPMSWWTLKKGTYDGRSVVLHELGHVLGLGDSTTIYCPGGAMCPNISVGEELGISPDDAAGIQALYP